MEADDYFAINGLIQRYLMLVDRGDFHGVGQLFSEADVIYTGPGHTISKNPQTITDLMESFVRIYDGTPGTLHQSGNISIDALGENIAGENIAASTSTAVVFQALPDLPLQVIATADYDDEFVKTNGQWSFTRRTIGMRLIGNLSKHLKRDPKSEDGGNLNV